MYKKLSTTFRNLYETIITMVNEYLILSNIDEGMKAKLTRISLGLRQVDLASAAKVDCIDITRLEKGRFVLPTKRERILRVLGLLNEQPEASNEQE